MGMAHYTSGKNGYFVNHFGSHIRFSNEQKGELLRDEQRLRDSDRYQELYSRKDDLMWFRDVTIMLQLECLQEIIEDIRNISQLNSPGEAEDRALKSLWSLRSDCREDPNLSNVTVYQKHDRSREGTLTKGVVAPDATLADRDGNKFSFYDHISKLNEQAGEKRPIFVIAGSVS